MFCRSYINIIRFGFKFKQKNAIEVDTVQQAQTKFQKMRNKLQSYSQLSNQKRILSQVNEYLKFDSNPRSFMELSSLLSVMNKSQVREFESLKFKIAQFMTYNMKYNDRKIDTLTPLMIVDICVLFEKKINFENNKNKKNKFKMRLLQILMCNMKNVDNYNNLKQIMRSLNKIIQRDISFDLLRFTEVVKMIQDKVMILTKHRPQGLSFYIQFFIFLQKFNFSSESSAKFFTFTISQMIRNEKVLKGQNLIMKSLLIYRSLHFYQISNQKQEIQLQGIYKNKILLTILEMYNNRKDFQNAFQNILPRQISHVFYFYIICLFHAQFLKTPKLQISGYQAIKQIGKPPKLEQYGLLYFNFSEQSIFKNHEILSSIMKRIYPEFIKEQYNKLQIEKINTTRFSTDNETILHLMIALDNLGYRYKKQHFLLGRKVDFFINDNIILEFDGQNHMNFRTMEINEKTGFRNYAYAAAGYKVVVMTMTQYNFNRSTEGIQEILREKLQLLERQNLCYIK